ncbi:PQQ-like beta-propeller repeat protein [Streptomyces sp. C10-9-1]|uniref:outer membrane protein assembly factor BamB family protein n=1 Tax=Streptomyces sp. C10-9-1 TaxID=1859285 RepID=UPI002112C262|nr:PQQ-binding-like beta-propeller repeat protein [Streptomyces sp. C10-9-1]MCQ6554959.1 PQQ-like beta-propeller repeat protein [Streptomyces sp. C10-9-1]
MVAKPARPVRRVLCGSLLALGVVGLLLGDGSRPDRPLGRPDSLAVEWSFRTSGRAADVSALRAVVGEELMAVPQGRTVSVVDTRDGRLLSTASSSADRFLPVGFSGGVMLAVEQRFGQAADSALSAYDPATGRRLWHRSASPAPGGGGADAWSGQAPLLPDAGPVIELADGRLAGVAPRTGAILWSRGKPPLAPCGTSGPDAHGSPPSPLTAAEASHHIAVLTGCPGRTAELEVVNAKDGGSVWSRELGRSRATVELTAVPGAIGVSLDGDLHLFTESGEPVLRRKADGGSGLRPVGAARGMVYLSEAREAVQPDPDASLSYTLHAVRADTGRTVWTRSGGARPSGVLTGGVVVGGLDVPGAYVGDLRWSPGDARLQGPGASGLTDPAGRRSSPVPWPVAGTFAGTSGDLLIVRSEEKEGSRYTALRPGRRAADAAGPVPLAGVERRDWPDACGLVGADLLASLRRDHVKLPVPSSRTVLGTGLPGPSVCRFAAKSGSDDDVFSVTVRWVAPDAEAAETYATSVIPWGCAPPLGGCVTAGIARPRPGVHLYTYRTGLRQLPVAQATVVSGRHVLGVSAGGNEPRSRALVRRVAMHLAERPASGPNP